MLIVTRKEGESLYLFLNPNTSSSLTAHELFAAGPIVITLAKQKSYGSARLSIEAPQDVLILRTELIENSISR